jgi:hypothetical protein
MIEIDTNTQKIFFYYSPEEIKQNSKRDDEMHEFDLLSGHVCPDCKRVIDAFYVGRLPIRENYSSSHPYMPSRNGTYNSYDPHYKFGHKHGGGYLIMYNHNDACKTHTCGTVGLEDGLRSVVNKESEVKPTDYMIKMFAEKVLENKIPGISLIQDVCNKRAPVLAINKKEFSKGIDVNGYSDFDKEYKWNELLTKLIMGDSEVKLVQ